MPSFALASSSRATDSSWSPAWWASSPRDRRSRTSSRVDASSSATLASSSSAWYDSADGGDAGAGDLHVLVGLDAGDADGAGHLAVHQHRHAAGQQRLHGRGDEGGTAAVEDRKSTRLNSSHVRISYAVFCLKKKKKKLK